MIGVCIQQPPWLMVLEFFEYGDLRNVLKAAASKNLGFELPEQLRIFRQVILQLPRYCVAFQPCA
jgi:hypothetical protein